MSGRPSGITFVAATLFLVCAAVSQAQVPGVEHVVVIGVDGLSPEGLQKAETPRLDALIAEGAHSFTARAVLPTVSSPNWASILMGAGPVHHGITSNDWSPTSYEIEPTEKGPGGIFPTIFSVLRGQRPDAYQAVIYHWRGFNRLFERELVNEALHGINEERTVELAAESIATHKPALLFVHIDHVDSALHSGGYLSEAYLGAIAGADRLIGALLDAVDSAGIADKTLVMVVSDHGGKDKGHGGSSMQEIIVPWLVRGPGVRRGHAIEQPITVYDTAATVAYALGLAPPRSWVARPVTEAFSEQR